MRRRFGGARISILIVCLTACTRTAPVPQIGYWISSDASQYSPVVAFRVLVTRDVNRLHIAIDTGTLTVPGDFAAPAPVAITDLYLTAYIATHNVGPLALALLPDSLRFPDRRGWRAVTSSDSVPLAPELSFGERRSIDHLQLTLAVPPGTDPSAWLVFRISGKVVDHRLKFEPRGALRVGQLGSTTRVYACSDRDLRGEVDTARSNGLRRAYGLLC